MFSHQLQNVICYILCVFINYRVSLKIDSGHRVETIWFRFQILLSLFQIRNKVLDLVPSLISINNRNLNWFSNLRRIREHLKSLKVELEHCQFPPHPVGIKNKNIIHLLRVCSRVARHFRKVSNCFCGHLIISFICGSSIFTNEIYWAWIDNQLVILIVCLFAL